MALKRELTDALIEAYKRGGEETGYWGYRFLRSLRNNGGLATAKRMLKPRSSAQRAGLDALLVAGRPDLSMEAVILRRKFRALFSKAELLVAAERLGRLRKEASRLIRTRERLYPEQLEPGRRYTEGARKQIRVNAYERNPQARYACVRHHGLRCAVCGLLFESRYGRIGKDFIHVHHLKPLALCRSSYELDPIKDLRPVCPNCHAMLHRGKRVLNIAALKAMVGRHEIS